MHAAALAAHLGARLVGPDVSLRRAASLTSAGPSDIAALFLSRFIPDARNTQAGVILLSPRFIDIPPTRCTQLITDQPRTAWYATLRALHGQPQLHRPSGQHSSAIIDPLAIVDPTAHIGPLAIISSGAHIAAEAVISAGAYVGPNVQIGLRTVLAPRSQVLDDSVIGTDCWIGPGAIIGSLGFGLDAQGRLPHPGTVLIGDRVSIGANSCVDRATVGQTIIGDDAHLDNLVQVGHNARVGPGAVLCGQVGLTGGAVVEAGAQLGGQSGVAARVGAGAKVAAQSGVTRDLPAGGTYSGHPAEPNQQRLRRLARLRREFDR